MISLPLYSSFPSLSVSLTPTLFFSLFSQSHLILLFCSLNCPLFLPSRLNSYNFTSSPTLLSSSFNSCYALCFILSVLVLLLSPPMFPINLSTTCRGVGRYMIMSIRRGANLLLASFTHHVMGIHLCMRYKEGLGRMASFFHLHK